jgi:hypothetical protein
VLVAAAPGPEPAVDLQWDGTAACPDAGLARERLEAYLAQSEGAASSEAVIARVVVSETEAGLEASLELSTAWGESRRTLRADRCEDIADAVALVVATTIDPLLGIRDPHDGGPAIEPEPEPLPEPEPEPLPDPDPLPPVDTPPPEADREASDRTPDPPPKRPAARSPITLLGAFGAGVGAGLRLHAGAVLDASMGVQWRRLRVLALGWYGFSGSRPVEGTPEGTIALRSWGAGLLACGVPGFGRFELPTCAGIEAGALHGESDGLAQPDSTWRPWLGVAARVGLHLRITPRVALALDVHGTGVVLRPTFHVEDQAEAESVYQAPPVAGRALLGVQVRWP